VVEHSSFDAARWLNSSAMPQMLVCLLPHLPYILVAVECLRIGFASSFCLCNCMFFHHSSQQPDWTVKYCGFCRILKCSNRLHWLPLYCLNQLVAVYCA
jgi:hypothetical protein